MRAVSLVSLLVCAAFLPSFARGDTLDQIRPQIDAANNRFGPAVRRHDAAAIAADYLSEGVLIPSKGVPIRGRAAIARYYASRMTSLDRFSSIHCATQRLAFDGTAALEEGACVLTRVKGAAITAHFLTVWKKDSDGRWRIAINE